MPVKVTALQDLANPAFYKNFTMQQSIFFLYGITVAAIKNTYRKADSERRAAAAGAEQAVSAIKSVSAHSFLSTSRGLQLFAKEL